MYIIYIYIIYIYIGTHSSGVSICTFVLVKQVNWVYHSSSLSFSDASFGSTSPFFIFLSRIFFCGFC